MVVASATGLVDFLRGSPLLPPEQLDQLCLNVRQRDPEPHELTQSMVQQGLLTSYQADNLLNGRPSKLVVGPYHLLESLGEGGMGQVFKAHHQHLNRLVALKMLREERLTKDPLVRRRFEREALAVAQLAHPNVIQVYDAGRIGEVYFIAMEYVAGKDLARLVKETGPLPVDQACEYIRQAALGLQHAHEHGLVHRDIKPSNLIVSRSELAPPRFGSSANGAGPDRAECPATSCNMLLGHPVWGLVKILDMGLVRLVHSDEDQLSPASLTCRGQVMGTPDFISPEQARDSHNVDIRADLYSLGCTFYYLLTRRPPFCSDSAMDKLLMHQLAAPTPLESLRPETPPQVVAVVHRLMAKDPQDRYQTPVELAEAIEALTLPTSRTAPASSLQVAEAAVHLAPTMASVIPGGLASTPVHREETEIVAPKKIATLPGHRGWVLALAFAANRELLATGGIDGVVRLWDFSGTEPAVTTLPRAEKGEVHSLAFAPDDSQLACGSGTLSGQVELWHLGKEGPQEVGELRRHKAPVEALAYSADGKWLASGSTDKTVCLWKEAGALFREWARLQGHRDCVTSMAFSPDGRQIVSGSQDGTIRLWNIGTLWCREEAVLHGHSGHVLTLAFSPDGKMLASGSADQTVRLWDLDKGKPVERAVLGGQHGVVRLVLFPPQSETLMSIDARGWVIQWEVASGRQLHEWRLSAAMVSSVALTCDGRYLATGNTNGTVSLFRLASRDKTAARHT